MYTVAPFLKNSRVIETSEQAIARFVGEPSSGISLDDGALVGDFAV